MPWRDEIQIDAVEYSDRPRATGPAPNTDGVESGPIAELTARDGDRMYDVTLQFWTENEATVHVDNPVDSAAGYIAWQIGEQSGLYGVFDGHAKRVWLGLDPFRHHGEPVVALDIGPDWRDKLHWNEFVDRLYVEHLQYPFEQCGPLTTVDGASIVTDPAAETTGEVYEIETKQLSATVQCRFQLWRPSDSQAVFVTVEQLWDDRWHADRGVLGRQYILSDVGCAIQLSTDAYSMVRDQAAGLRSLSERCLTIDDP